MFQEEPAEPYAPGMAFATSMAQFILNQGKVYYFWPYTSALSKFSVDWPGMRLLIRTGYQNT